MKTPLIFATLATTILLSNCSNSEFDTTDVVKSIPPSSYKEIDRLKKEGTISYDQENQISIRTPMYHLQGEVKCEDDTKDARGTCETVGIEAYQNYIPPEYKTDKCDSDGWCSVIQPKFPKDIVGNLDWAEFYGFGEDVYTIGSVNRPGDPTGDNTYQIFKNNEEIFSHQMFFGEESVVEDASQVLDSPAFTFYDLGGWLEGWDSNGNAFTTPTFSRNIWYKDETLNQKYDMNASSYLFAFENKIGFVGEKGGKKFFFFNGQKISADFDEITTNSCCAGTAYPIEVDKNGILLSLAKRGEIYYFVEVDLNQFL